MCRDSEAAALAADERGSAPVEFVLVSALLTVLTLGVLQLGVAVYVRGVALDAAVDGAFHAALADVPDADGAARARDILTRTVGAGFVQRSDTRVVVAGGRPTVEVRLTVTLPVAGLVGIPGGWEVRAHAPLETFE
ncbi:TadE/TadG family type IV pilus assembly protein [Microbacterium radiodurans]|uniref:TadE family protein n=1 Tax=Microbacterium radiodurans TaxID=661398 RepID=A0A5J5IVB7_9MICO|nr:TadE/TadG family type IV pilus assembly protein [Microbacterium radiodurans]KAA9086972.1 TadE family protein [Microbacterium radiodurans]